MPEGLLKLSNSDLRKELQKYGEIPGPILPSTKNVYIKRLARLQSGSANSKVKRKYNYCILLILKSIGVIIVDGYVFCGVK